MLKRLLIIVSIVGLLVNAPLAAAAPTPYTAKTGTTFNNPLGSSADQQRIVVKVVDAINHAPKGSLITVATYTITDKKYVTALINARKRGVHVQVVTDNHAENNNAQLTKLKNDLKKDKKSLVKICKYGCMSSDPQSLMHAKFVLFSKTGSSSFVSMTGSFNLSTASATYAWNNLYTLSDFSASGRKIAGNDNKQIYDSYMGYFKDLIKDKSRKDYDVTNETTDEKYKNYFYPQEWKKGEINNTMYQVLENTVCKGASKGYGDTDGRTNIRVAMYKWTKTEMNLAKKLWSMDNAGCNVTVIIGTMGSTSPEIMDMLLKKGGKNGGIDVYRARTTVKVKDGKNTVERAVYLHSKYMAINGKYDGDPKSKIVWTGSLNYEKLDQRISNENIMKIVDDSAYDQYMDNFKDVIANKRTDYLSKQKAGSNTDSLSAASVLETED